MKKRVLFICTHNSARSQMAEGLLRAFYGNRYEAYSAGTQPSKVNPYAIKVMAEIGINISSHHSKNIDVFYGMKFNYVVTVCNQAKEICPFFQGGDEYLHRDFNDPSQIEGSKDEKLAFFRHTRNAIKDWIDKIFGKEDKNALIYRLFSRTKKLNWCIDPYEYVVSRRPIISLLRLMCALARFPPPLSAHIDIYNLTQN